MIVKRIWITEKRKHHILMEKRNWEGWFLFGILPLYIRATKLIRYI